MNARAYAFALLRKWESGKDFADELLTYTLSSSNLSAKDRALLTELFLGVLRNRILLDSLISTMTARPPRRQPRILLQLGIYQLLFLSRVPAYAAVSATTDLAKEQLSKSEADFIHAVLRRAAGNLDELRETVRYLQSDKPWDAYSHPLWLFKRWEKRWGRENAEALCKWNNAPPPVVLRVNRSKTTSEKLLKMLTSVGIQAKPHVKAPDNCIIVKGVRTENIPGFVDGFYYAQDPSTLLAVEVMEPQPGEVVLDACAAPGGKALYIAELMGDDGCVVACDASSQRLRALKENCRRLGTQLIVAQKCDFSPAGIKTLKLTMTRKSLPDLFDCILVDAPCSNTGVMRRRVDVRWRIREQDLGKMAAIQVNLLRATAPLLRKGGRLVYSTCSLEQEENEAVVEGFLAHNREFSRKTIHQTFPPRDDVDGAFAALLTRS